MFLYLLTSRLEAPEDDGEGRLAAGGIGCGGGVGGEGQDGDGCGGGRQHCFEAFFPPPHFLLSFSIHTGGGVGQGAASLHASVFLLFFVRPAPFSRKREIASIIICGLGT